MFWALVCTSNNFSLSALKHFFGFCLVHARFYFRELYSCIPIIASSKLVYTFSPPPVTLYWAFVCCRSCRWSYSIKLRRELFPWTFEQMPSANWGFSPISETNFSSCSGVLTTLDFHEINKKSINLELSYQN